MLSRMFGALGGGRRPAGPGENEAQAQRQNKQNKQQQQQPASHGSSFRTILTVASVTCLVILAAELVLFQMAFNQAQVHGSEVNKLLSLINARGKYEMKPVQRAKHASDKEDTAFVLLGLNSYARQLKCEGAIESLRKIGGWSGKIFLLTNQEGCYDPEKMQESGLTDVTIVNVDVVQASSQYLRSSHRTSKQLKAEVFEYLPDEVHNVILMDCDMLIGKPDCVKQFVDDVTTDWSTGYIRFARTGDRIHTGIMVANRKRSAQALKTWSERLATLQDSMDHYAYERVWHRLRSEGEDYMEVIGLPKTYEAFYRPDRAPACFNHISHKRCHVYGRDKVREYVSHFDLETYKGDTHYCESLLLLPVTYGWVSAPPKCTKLENIM